MEASLPPAETSKEVEKEESIMFTDEAYKRAVLARADRRDMGPMTLRDAVKEQPMSDTLLEREDQMSNQRKQLEYEASEVFDYGTRQRARERLAAMDAKEQPEHQVTKSGTCVIPGCPCRGWSAQETAGVKEVSDPPSLINAAKEVEAWWLEQGMHKFSTAPAAMFDLRAAIKEYDGPVARGGGEEWRVVELGRNTYIERDAESPFICDMQTYDSSDAERKEARQLANQIVDEHRQHQSLVAERERLRKTIEVAIHNLDAGSDPKFLADYLRLILDQKGGPQ